VDSSYGLFVGMNFNDGANSGDNLTLFTFSHHRSVANLCGPCKIRRIVCARRGTRHKQLSELGAEFVERLGVCETCGVEGLRGLACTM